MKKIIIFGNSGAGKSTLAKKLSARFSLSLLDLDTLAWIKTQPPARAPLDISAKKISEFLNQNSNWVIEGCYADLLKIAIKEANHIMFLNPGDDTCIKNCQKRPWEPHKYESPEAQNKNLPMLIDWVRDYSNRNDEFSLTSHQKLFNEFTGKKEEITSLS